MQRRRNRCLLTGLLLVLLASGCTASNDETEISLRANSDTNDRVEVSYGVDGERFTEVVEVPWETVVVIDGSGDLELTVNNLTDSGEVFCKIDLGVGSPDIWAEQTASCQSMLSTSGNTLRSSGSTEAIDREVVAAPVDDLGITYETRIVDDDRNPTQPTIGETFIVQLVFSGMRGPVTIRHDVEVTIEDQIASNRGAERFEATAAGEELIVGIRRLTPAVPGPVTVTISGTVFGANESFEFPFSDSLEFEVPG